MPRIRLLVCLSFVLLLLPDLTAAAGKTASLAEFVKARLVAHAFSRMDAFRLCEAYSKEDKKAFFNRVLAVDVFADASAFESREFFLLNESAPEHRLHLGTLVLTYAQTATAREIQESLQKQRILLHSIIRTPVVAVAVEDSVVVIYSESAENQDIKSFLDKIPAELAATQGK